MEIDCSCTTTVFQIFGQMLFLSNPEILPSTPMLPRSGNIGRPPQAGAAAHACTDLAARNAHAEPSDLHASPCFLRSSLRSGVPSIFDKKLKEPRGRGGELFPPHAFPALTFPPPEYHALPSAPDTLYGPMTCTVVISFNAGSESRLFMTTGRAPDVARGPRALKKRTA